MDNVGVQTESIAISIRVQQPPPLPLATAETIPHVTPAEMAKEVRRLDAGWSAVIREIGIKLDQ